MVGSSPSGLPICVSIKLAKCSTALGFEETEELDGSFDNQPHSSVLVGMWIENFKSKSSAEIASFHFPSRGAGDGTGRRTGREVWVRDRLRVLLNVNACPG